MTSDRAQEFAEYMTTMSTEQGEMLTDYQKEALEYGVDSKADNSEAMDKELENMSQDNKIEGNEGSLNNLIEFLNPANWVSACLHAVVALLVGIIQIIVLGLGIVSMKVLIILGPLVFAVSILPVFQKQLANWFYDRMFSGHSLYGDQHIEPDNVVQPERHIHRWERQYRQRHSPIAVSRSGHCDDRSILQLLLAGEQNSRA